MRKINFVFNKKPQNNLLGDLARWIVDGEQQTVVHGLLMHSPHLLSCILVPPPAAAIIDTQYGFKLFSRPALYNIISCMHCEG